MALLNNIALVQALEEYIHSHYEEENVHLLHKGSSLGEKLCSAVKSISLPSDKFFHLDPLEDDWEEDFYDEDYSERATCDYELCDAKCLAPSRTLDNLIDNLDETFSQMLLRLIDERNLKDSQVYNRANIDRRHFSKIRNNKDYVPTKKTVISFAIALKLTLDEAIDLLNRAGYAFSKSSKFDVIICFFLEQQIYDMFEINEVLLEYGQPILE